MKNRILSTLGIAAALAAPCALPTAAVAQASPTAARPPAAAQVQITTDYVTTPFLDFVNKASRISPGKEHDAQLLAALLKDGAQDEQGPQVTTTAGVPGRIGLETQIPAGPALTTFVQAKPRINKDGSITVEMTNHRETLSSVVSTGALLPSKEITEVTQTDTFTDGQTLMVNSLSTNSVTDKWGNPSALLIFVKVKSVGKPAAVPAAAQTVSHP